MEDYSILKVNFASDGNAAAFCELVNEYRDRLWQETSKQLDHKRMSDVSKFEIPAKEVFEPYVERLQKLLHNWGIEAEDYRLLQNCTVAREGAEVQLVVEGPGNVWRLAEEWIFMLRSSSPDVVSRVERKRKS